MDVRLTEETAQRMARAVRLVEQLPEEYFRADPVSNEDQDFATGGVNVQYARLTSLTKTSGRYPGVLVLYNASASDGSRWSDGDAIWVEAANGEVLALSTRYEGRMFDLDGGKFVFIVDGVGVMSITSINGDVTPAQDIGLGIAGTDINIATAGIAWSSGQQYQAGWIATHSAKTWRATAANLNDMPPSGNWVEVTGGGVHVINVPDWGIEARGGLNDGAQTGKGDKTIVGSWTIALPYDITSQNRVAGAGGYSFGEYKLKVVDNTNTDGTERATPTTPVSAGQGANWTGINPNGILLVNGPAVASATIYMDFPFLSPFGSDLGWGLTFVATDQIFSPTVSGTGSMNMSLDPSLGCLVLFTSNQGSQIPPAYAVWNGITGLHIGDYYTDSIGNVFAGGVHVGNTAADPVTPAPVALTSNLAKVAINAPTLVIVGTGISATHTDDSITFSTLGATATVNSSPAPTSTSMTVTFGTPPSGTGYLLAKITVSGTDSVAGIPVAIIVPAPTVSVTTTAIGAGAQTITVTGTGFGPNPSDNSIAFTTLGTPTGTIQSVASDGTSMTVSVAAPTGTGQLKAIVTSYGGASGSAIEVAVVGASSGPSVTVGTATLASNATTLIIYGNFFDTTAGNNTVAFSPAGTGTVTAATAHQLTVTITVSGLVAGPLTVIVTTNSVTSGAAVQVATVAGGPTVTVSTTNLADNATSLTISGNGFDPVPANNTVALNNGTATIIGSSTTSLNCTVSGLVAGSLTATVTTNGQASSSVQVATVVTITVTPNTASISTAATSISIAGTNFEPAHFGGGGLSGIPTTASFNAMGLNNSVTWAALDGTGIVASFLNPPLPTGSLTVVVNAWGGSSGAAVQVATVATTSAPTVTVNTANIAYNAGSITITGTNFDPTPANNTWIFNEGVTGTTASVSGTTSAVVTITNATSNGSLTAVLTTSFGGSSGAAVQVGTTTGVASHSWLENFVEASNTAVQSHTPNTGSGGYSVVTGSGQITGGAPGWYATGMGQGQFSFDPGVNLTSASVTFTWRSSITSLEIDWNGRGQVVVGSGVILLNVGSHTTSPSVTLTAGTSYTMTIADNGSVVSVTLNSITATVTDSASRTGTTCEMELVAGSVDPTALITNVTVN